MRTTNQKVKILNYLKEHDGITQRTANYLGVYRLADVIFKLKKDGHYIKTELRIVENADGTQSRIGVYHLVKSAEK